MDPEINENNCPLFYNKYYTHTELQYYSPQTDPTLDKRNSADLTPEYNIAVSLKTRCIRPTISEIRYLDLRR